MQLQPIHYAVLAVKNKIAVLKYLIEEIGINPHEGNKVNSYNFTNDNLKLNRDILLTY